MLIRREIVGNSVRKIFSKLINRQRKLLLIDLSRGLDLSSLYTQYQYSNETSYVAVQTGKTKRRLRDLERAPGSIFWSDEKNIELISDYIKKHFQSMPVSGLCMGSRSGEEQALFLKYLPSSVICGVELEASAKSIKNTIISDFHNLISISSSTQDFVYSNSHDQSDKFFVAITEWLRVLRPGGLLFLEHSRAHGKLRVGRQDPFGAESEILPFLMLMYFQNQISLECILTPVEQFEDFHLIFTFQKN